MIIDYNKIMKLEMRTLLIYLPLKLFYERCKPQSHVLKSCNSGILIILTDYTYANVTIRKGLN